MIRHVPPWLCALFLLAGSVPAHGQLFSRLRESTTTYPRVNVASGYLVDPAWPQHADLPAWGEMPGIAVDRHDHVWTFNRGALPVQVFTPDGKVVRTWGQGVIEKAHHIRVDHDSNIWITDIGLHVVRQFTPEGELLRTLGTPGEAGEDSTHFNQPTDVAVTPQGHIFVSDGYGNNRIVHFDPQGQYLGAWGSVGSLPGQFSLPHALAIDSTGLIYVADRNNARIQVFDQTGTFRTEWRDLLVPWHLWITPDDSIYACGSSPMRWATKLPVPGMMVGIPPKDQLLMKLDRTGRIERLWTFPLGTVGEMKPGELCWVHALALDSQGNLYMGDIQGHRAQKYIPLDSDVARDGPTPRYAGPSDRDPAVQPASVKDP